MTQLSPLIPSISPQIHYILLFQSPAHLLQEPHYASRAPMAWQCHVNYMTLLVKDLHLRESICYKVRGYTAWVRSSSA